MTNQSKPLTTLTCPKCGAPLEMHSPEPTIKCRYCETVVDNPDYHLPKPVRQPAPVHIDLSQPLFVPTASQKKTVTRALWITVLLVVVFTGGLAFLIYKLSAGTGNQLIPTAFPLQVNPPALMLNTDGGAPNIVSVTRDSVKNTYGLSRLDLATHKAVWTSLNQEEYFFVDALVSGDTLLYVIIKTRLLALQLSDGSQAWEATLPDQLYSAGVNPVLFKGGQVIVLTTDERLSAYDALTGHQTWEKTFNNTGRSLYSLKDGFAMVYSGERGSFLGVFDPQTGTERVHIEPVYIAQNGMGDEMEFYSNLVIDSSITPAKAYLFFGLFNAIVQKWDLTTGKMDWQYVEEEQNLDNYRDIPVLLAGANLYYIQDKQLRILDTETGTHLKILDQFSDYELIPVLVTENRLIVRATRTRGTTRYELWGYDLDASKNLWKHPFLNSGPIDPPDEMMGILDSDTSGWTYRLAQSGLWLITFQSQPFQVTLARVNLDSGELSDQNIVDLGIESASDMLDTPERVNGPDAGNYYVLENRIYGFDLTAGGISYRWP